MNRTMEIQRFQIVCRIFKDNFRLILRFPSNKYFINHVIACVFNVLLTLSTLCLNSITILTFWNSSQLRSKVSNFLILVQSCIDLGVGAIGSSLFTFSLLDEIRGTGNCWLRIARGHATVFLTIISMTTLSAMNMERYFGVVHPFFHRDKVTRNRLLVYVILLSSLVVIFFCLSFAFNGIIRYLGVVVIFLYLSSMSFAYTRIYLASIASSRTVHAEPSQEERKKKRQFLKDVKLAKTCFLIVACSLLCLLPTGISARTSYFLGFDRVFVVIWAKTFALLNPSLNSAIFFWKNPMLRSEARKTLTNIYTYMETTLNETRNRLLN